MRRSAGAGGPPRWARLAVGKRTRKAGWLEVSWTEARRARYREEWKRTRVKRTLKQEKKRDGSLRRVRWRLRAERLL